MLDTATVETVALAGGFSEEATHILEQALARSEELSILDLRGLGKQHWRGIEATIYVADERDSWE